MPGNEHSSNEGYIAFRPEVNEGVVAGTPNVYGVLYNDGLTTALNANTENAVFGSKAARLLVTPNTRSHNGTLEVLAEPNSSHLLWGSLITLGSPSGTNPTTWPLSASFTKPKSLTVDISGGNQVWRFIGVQASEISPSWEDGRCHWNMTVSALKSFLGAEIASVSTNIVTLKTPVHNPAPTTGLFAGDLVSIVAGANGTRQNLTITSVTATTVVLSGSPTGVTSGDMLILRPATPSLDIADPFLWPRTEFRFGDTAANALNATHTSLEEGTTFTVSHPFKDEAGEKSSGSFDPSRLVRAQSVDVTFSTKKFFENPDELRSYQALTNQACVVRMFSGTNYEFRLTLNKLTSTKGGDKGMIKVDEALFYEQDLTPSVSTVDGQMFDVKVLNAKSS